MLGGLIGAAGSVVGGLLGAKGADRAADISAQGSQAALDENGRQFDLSMLANILLNMPTINQGNTARSALSAMLGLSTPGTNYKKFAAGMGSGVGGGAGGSISDAFGMLRDPGSQAIRPNRLMRQLENTPGYQFVKDQAVDGVLANGRAMGLGKSGATVGAVGDTIGQGLAFPMYQSYLDRLAGMAGAGSGSSAGLASNIGNLATNSGALNAGLIQNGADSRASGVLGKYQNYADAANSVSKVVGDYFGKPQAGNYNFTQSNQPIDYRPWAAR